MMTTDWLKFWRCSFHYRQKRPRTRQARGNMLPRDWHVETLEDRTTLGDPFGIAAILAGGFGGSVLVASLADEGTRAEIGFEDSPGGLARLPRNPFGARF